MSKALLNGFKKLFKRTKKDIQSVVVENVSGNLTVNCPEPTFQNWVVYKQFSGIRGELQGGVLEGFEVIFG